MLNGWAGAEGRTAAGRFTAKTAAGGETHKSATAPAACNETPATGALGWGG